MQVTPQSLLIVVVEPDNLMAVNSGYSQIGCPVLL